MRGELLTIIQNDPNVPVGFWGDQILALGLEYRLVRLFSGEAINDQMLESGGVIVLGGTMGVHDTDEFPYLLQLKEFIRGCLSRKVPLLGICLGGQLVAEVLGAAIHSGRHRECGTFLVDISPAAADDSLFAGITTPFTTFQWHNDSFDLPKGATMLASSKVCPCQAFRYGNAWGLQFHPEINVEIVTQWCNAESKEEHASDNNLRIINELENNLEEYTKSSVQMFHNFAENLFQPLPLTTINLQANGPKESTSENELENRSKA
ncbi:type 1 glutamine amidotransferase [Citrifermentans pelophilum]|nr:type 1 glutamine amidotransferase [Geoanaerobacter pelophilus]